MPPALSPDGSRVAFQMMTKDDWEIYVVDRDGSGESASRARSSTTCCRSSSAPHGCSR